MMRAFLAVNFSVAVTRRIAEEVERHKAAVGPDVRVAWVAPANYHVTMHFFGAIPEELVEGIAGRLRPRLARLEPFEAKARGFGCFPSLERPRVLWVGVDAGAQLGVLFDEVQAVVGELGLPKEERKLHPHLTVGRVKPGAPTKVGGAEGAVSGGPITWSSDAELGMSQVHEMVLYESRTTPKGSEYTARARVALGNK